jgi:tetratricopeptide (TPR) repeat protein
MAYRPYRGRRRRRGLGLGARLAALAAGTIAVGLAWWLHLPAAQWGGAGRAEALAVEAEPTPPPSSGLAFLDRGDDAFRRGRWTDAAEEYRRATEAEPTFASAHARWARALLNHNRLDAAVERGRAAVAADPASAYARATLAVALSWRGEVELAAREARRAVELDPGSGTALAALAEAYVDGYRLPEADELLDLALGIAPTDPDLHRVRGLVHETRADYGRAVAEYRRAVELAPDWSYLRLCLGHALRAGGRFDEALAEFARAAELAPMDPRAEGGRGMVHAALEDRQAAAQHLRRSVEIDPDYATGYAQLAWLHYAHREYDRAAPLFERAIGLDRDPARVAQYRHALGWIHVSARRPSEARQEFLRSLELDPKLQGARDGLAAIGARR